MNISKIVFEQLEFSLLAGIPFLGCSNGIYFRNSSFIG